MIRYNFLEVHLRLCETKFMKKQICSTYDEALKIYFEQYCAQTFRKIDSHIWRKECLWKEDCDLALKR